MKLVVGLGNPDGMYSKTYHNIGFITIDKFAKKCGVSFDKKKCKSEIARLSDVIFAKPQTYMNLSGDAVLELKKYFKIKNEDILIILDDIDLPKGKIRFRESGSAGTHNGLRDIVKKVGETPRLRIGIGKPDDGRDLADYVLSNIDAMSKELIDTAIEQGFEIIENFVFNKENIE